MVSVIIPKKDCIVIGVSLVLNTPQLLHEMESQIPMMLQKVLSTFQDEMTVVSGFA